MEFLYQLKLTVKSRELFLNNQNRKIMKPKKMKQRLADRIAAWKRLPASGVSNKDRLADNAKHTWCRKPGSNNK